MILKFKAKKGDTTRSWYFLIYKKKGKSDRAWKNACLNI